MRKQVEESTAAESARWTTRPAAERDRKGRFSARRKRATVLRLLRGENLESVSRELGITAARASTHESQQAGRAIREAAVRAGRELGKAGRGLGRASATVGRSLRTGAESAHRVGEYTREATTTNGRTCHDLDQRIRNAVEERSRHDRRLGQTYEGYRRALSVIHPEAEQKRKDEDRPDRVAGSH